MKILTVIGARPQFIKAGVVSKALRAQDGLSEVLLHTGQHFDLNMSQLFFDQLGLEKPAYELGVHGGSYSEVIGRMMLGIEDAITQEKPDCVMVYGDTNSTLAGALAASNKQIRLAHVEAGLRSYNMAMPEELNRLMTDRLSDVLFCPTERAMLNLEQEELSTPHHARIILCGDVMLDAVRAYQGKSVCPEGLEEGGEYILCTFHRAENTDHVERLKQIVVALNAMHEGGLRVVVPLHPRTKAALKDAGLVLRAQVVAPVGYLEMLWLLEHCELVMTDSGGLQKEAYFHAKPCVSLRDETEWSELVAQGANMLAGADAARILEAAEKMRGVEISTQAGLYGDGRAAQKIAEILAAI